ncbi:MAG: peptidoglycan-binding domain-containing protein [bacterium]|nr:peptidoglycan-binding domain-containing protein [bacterium]
MPKKLAVLGASLAFVATLTVPLSTSANSIAPGLTEAQKSAIISLLQSFGADSKTIANVQTALGGSTPVPTSCVDLFSNTTLGSSGGEVTKLQNYLIARGDLDAQYNTGYYGFITAKAVGKIQLDLGIVSSANDTAYGIMGPKTRAAIGCSGSTVPPTPRPEDPTNPSATISEQVKCVFSDEATEQKCWGDAPSKTVGDPTHYSCTGFGTCVMTVSGRKGTPITWGSSCGGTANTTIDGSNEYAHFHCPETTKSSTTIDQSSLTSVSTHPTITGLAYNVSSIGLSISRGGEKFDGTGTFSVVSNRWIVTLNSQTYTSGTYGIQVYDGNNKLLTTGTLTVGIPGPVITFFASPSTIAAGNASTLYWSASNSGACGISVVSGDSLGIDLTKAVQNSSAYTSVTTGVLTQTATYQLRCAPLSGSTAPYAIKDVTVTVTGSLASSATIDSKSLTTTSKHPLITGTATNVKTIGLSISTSGGDKFDGTGTFSVLSSGRWEVTLDNETYTPGTYGIKVYDGSNNFLTSGTLTVTSLVTCSLTATNPYDSAGKQIPVTLTWTSQNASSASAQYYYNGDLIAVSLETVGTNGIMIVNPRETATYTFTFVGSEGSKACTVQVGLKG